MWGFEVKIAVAVVLALSLAACGASQPDPSHQSSSPTAPTGSLVPVGSVDPSPQSPLPPTALPSATPSPSAPPAATIPVGRIAVVVTNDLRVRSKPRVAADSKLLTPLLDKGRAVYVVDGPVHASGFTWYEVAPMRAKDEPNDLPFGWVAAAGKDGEPWVAGGAYRCPARPTDVATFLAVPALAGLACFGRHDLAISGRLARPEATCGVDIGWTIEPEWLASTCPHPEFYLADDNTTGASFELVLNPGTDVGDLDPGVEPAEWLDVLVTGHFDVRAAANCHGVVTEPGTVVELSPAEIVLACRATFVVTGIETSGYLP
jgi:hypothetical protein